MTLFYAQPYNLSAEGFYFKTAEQFAEKSNGLTDPFGQPVEEFEIQLMDGGQLTCELFEAWRPGQGDIGRFITACDDWSEENFLMAIIALRDLGYRPDQVSDDPEDLPIKLYRIGGLKELAEEFVEDGLFGDIQDRLAPYLDYDAIARDLSYDGFTETIVAGERLIYWAE